jgi:hypothetical protein
LGKQKGIIMMNQSVLAQPTLYNVDFITPGEVTGRCYMTYPGSVFPELATRLQSVDTLPLRCREGGYDTMIPVPPTPMSLLDIRKAFPNLFYPMANGGGGYVDHQSIRDEKTSPGPGVLIIREPLPGSIGKSWEEQIKLLSETEEVPTLAEVVWFAVVLLKVRSVRLFENIGVGTRSLDSSGRRIQVSSGPDGLLDISALGGSYRLGAGVASKLCVAGI